MSLNFSLSQPTQLKLALKVKSPQENFVSALEQRNAPTSELPKTLSVECLERNTPKIKKAM